MSDEPDPAYIDYVDELVRLGHDRDWIRRNAPALLNRFRRDPVPFRSPVQPHRPAVECDRYEELE